MITAEIKTYTMKQLEPVTKLLVKWGIHPNLVTTVGLLLNIVAAVTFASGVFRLASFFLVLAGLCDMLDGAVAREINTRNRFGAFYDSMIDRYSEIVIFIGIAWYYLHNITSISIVVLIILSLSGSLMVSYARARAEGLGKRCTVGILERPERIILLILGGFMGPRYFIIVLWILAIFTHITAFQRMQYISQQIKSCDADKT